MFARSQGTMFSFTQLVVFKHIQIWHWFWVFTTSLVEAWKYIMMLYPLNVVLELNRFVNVTCGLNIRGEYFKALYYSISSACWFFTNQLTGVFVPLHKYKFTSKTGGFESYDSHQFLCGGMVEVNSEPFRIAWFGKRLYIHPDRTYSNLIGFL